MMRAAAELSSANDIDLSEIGSTQLDWWSEMLRRADRDVEALSDTNPLAHVKYKELIKDPIATVKRIYEGFGWNFSKKYEEALEEYIQKNKIEREKLKKGKGSLHKYTLEEFDLSKEKVDKSLGWYSKKYLASHGGQGPKSETGQEMRAF